MKYALSMHELDGSEYLKHVEFYFLESERVFLIFKALIEIHIHEFEHKCEFTWIIAWLPLGSS